MIDLSFGVPSRAVVGAVGANKILFNDQFEDVRAAGEVIGTPYTPGGIADGVRGGADPEGKLSIGGGVLTWLRHTAVSVDNSWLRWGPIQRAPGVTVHFRARYAGTSDGINDQYAVTMEPTSTEPGFGAAEVQWRALGGPTRFIVNDVGNGENLANHAAVGVWEEIAIVLKASGAMLYRWDGSAWGLLKDRSGGASSALYVFWANYIDIATPANSDGEMSFIRATTRPPSGIPMPS